MEGQIVKIISDLHFVEYDNNVYPCKCRGIFRKEHIMCRLNLPTARTSFPMPALFKSEMPVDPFLLCGFRNDLGDLLPP